MKTGLANATGGVTLENTARKMTGSGDRAVYDAHETGYIELIGNARATQDGNTVTGNKIRVTNISGKDSRTHAQGNVRIVYHPQEKNEPEETEVATLAQNTKGKRERKADAATLARKAGSDTEDKTV